MFRSTLLHLRCILQKRFVVSNVCVCVRTRAAFTRVAMFKVDRVAMMENFAKKALRLWCLCECVCGREDVHTGQTDQTHRQRRIDGRKG